MKIALSNLYQLFYLMKGGKNTHLKTCPGFNFINSWILLCVALVGTEDRVQPGLGLLLY